MVLLKRVLVPVVDVRDEETALTAMMFGYSFLAMTAYNMVQPITRSKFITVHGAENLPYVVLASIVLIALLMQGYSRLGRLMPGRWIIPLTQSIMVGLLVLFWILYADPAAMRAPSGGVIETSAVQGWVATTLYWFGQIYAILLISQFWTLANLLFDPRQAKRLFGFIGAGASLGGFVGGSVPAFLAQTLGSRQLLLVSAIVLAFCTLVVVTIVSRVRGVDLRGLETAGEEQGVGGQEALRMLRESKHLQIIAIVIGLTSIGAGLVDQQLNMATEEFAGRDRTDAMTAVLGRVQVYVSAIGFLIQMFLTTRIQRLLGVGFALMLLPVGFGVMAVIILLNAALWAPMLARVMDKSLRYTVDKTSREILFLPLPDAIKNKAKPFVDVTADRFARALQGFVVLILIAPWGLGLTWQQISYASLVVLAVWIIMVVVAKRAYARAFRTSLTQRVVRAADLRLSVADLTTIETLVEELAHPDSARVLYAVDLLESLDKRNLVTPLLLSHESPAVKVRALGALASVRGDIAVRWVPQIRRLLGDPDPAVRAAAIGALASISRESAATLSRPLLSDPDPRIRVTAAAALASGDRAEDLDAAEEALAALVLEADESARDARREVAAAIRQIADPKFHGLLIHLMHDPDQEVAEEAIESVRARGTSDFRFVPALVALLRSRRLKGRARSVLAGYGDPVVDVLAHFLRDPDEDLWVRRHIPATLALIASQRTVDVLVAALEEPDGFLRFKAVAALERLRREHPDLACPREPIEALTINESRRYFDRLTLYNNLFERSAVPRDTLLAQALQEKMARAQDRIYRLLSLVHPWCDIAAARWTMEHGDQRGRARASEYLDNVLSGPLRRQVLPAIEGLPMHEKVRRGNVLLRSRPRDVEETLLRLINDDDQVVAASAIDLVRQRQLWTLAPDIEHVLEYRDARDWYVFESASWALAEQRLPVERRRQLWLEPLPAAELAGRLRHLPLFASVSVDELFRIAGASRQVRHEPGKVLLEAGAVPECIHFLLDGRIHVCAHDSVSRIEEVPAALGFDEAIQGLAMTETVRTADLAVTLAMTCEELRTLLADNTELVSGLAATIASRMESGDLPIASVADPGELERLDTVDLTSVDKILALHHVPLFERVSAGEMLHLATTATTVQMAAGAVVFPASARPALWLVLSGEIALQAGPGAPRLARSGDVIGTFALMTGRSLGLSGEAVRGGLALRIDREDLLERLAERPELLRQIFNGIFRLHRHRRALPSDST